MIFKLFKHFQDGAVSAPDGDAIACINIDLACISTAKGSSENLSTTSNLNAVGINSDVTAPCRTPAASI